MTLWQATLQQMLILLILIALGFILVKARVLETQAASVLAKLENTVLIPALILNTFCTHFTMEKLRGSRKLFLFSFLLEIIVIPLAILLAKLVSKDSFIRKITTYGFAFSNFGFMGNAVFSALFPKLFAEYIIFTLPLWTLIYIWGTPALLIPLPESGRKPSLKIRLLACCNPMFIAILLGIILGLSSSVFRCPPLSSRPFHTVRGACPRWLCF